MSWLRLTQMGLLLFFCLGYAKLIPPSLPGRLVISFLAGDTDIT